MTSVSVAVVVGGPSAEANVSRTSGRAVADALTSAGYRSTLLELDADLPRALSAEPFDVAFPVTHGPLGEDGCLQGLLEVLDLRYVGSDVLASALAASKPVAKVLFRAVGLPVAADMVVRAGDDSRLAAQQARRKLGGALVVKPACGGSAIATSRIDANAADDELASAIGRALEVDDAAIVEPFVRGREVTCGVLEEPDGNACALPPTLIEAQGADWYDFTSRYGSGKSRHYCPAPFEPDLIQRIQDAAVGAHRALGCRDLSRADFVVGDSGEVTLLEVNTLPGMTSTSLFPEAAAARGVTFVELCSRLVERARTRRPRRIPAPLPMP